MKVRMILAVNFPMQATGKKKPEKKIRASTGFEPVTSAIPVRCSTNWAMKPHIGSEVRKIHCEDHSHFHLWPQFKYMNYFIYIYIISLLTGRYELNKLTSLPMCGFIAQLVEHRTGIAEVTGSNPVEALIFFSGFFFPVACIGKFTARIILTFICCNVYYVWKEIFFFFKLQAKNVKSNLFQIQALSQLWITQSLLFKSLSNPGTEPTLNHAISIVSNG